MSYFRSLKCRVCSEEFAPKTQFVCLNCFGPLEVSYDYDSIRREVSREVVSQRPLNLWRYRELLPIAGEPIAGDHSGWTPLIHAENLGRRLGLNRLYIKDDSSNYPTLSYKDRVVSVALSRGRELGYSTFACASTGNLGNAVSAHCARIGAPCIIFVPSDIERAKILGSLVYGPRVIALEGTYDDVNRLCSEIGDEYGWGFVNVNLRPYYTEGAKTIGFEIAEQMDWRLPDHVVLPTAGGTLLPKAFKAFQELRILGWAEGSCRFHTAQAEGCAPVVRALRQGRENFDPVKPNTIAKSIAIGNPADGQTVLQAVRESGGWGETASDPEILSAIRLLAETEGIFTEPAGGTTLAVAIKLIEQGRIEKDSVLVVGITGNGYKAADALENEVAVSAQMRPNLRIFQQWYSEAGEVDAPARSAVGG